jgi:hypothetical protein
MQRTIKTNSTRLISLQIRLSSLDLSSKSQAGKGGGELEGQTSWKKQTTIEAVE